MRRTGSMTGGGDISRGILSSDTLGILRGAAGDGRILIHLVQDDAIDLGGKGTPFYVRSDQR